MDKQFLPVSSHRRFPKAASVTCGGGKNLNPPQGSKKRSFDLKTGIPAKGKRLGDLFCRAGQLMGERQK